jgi:hypothetical protein
MLPYVDVEVVERDVDVAAAAAAADEVRARGDGGASAWREELGAPLHYDLAVCAVADERCWSSVARVFAVGCDDGGVDDNGGIAHAAAWMVGAGGG